MLYYFLKVTVRIFIRIFYRNPLLLNKDLVPQQVPLILASNHPNALCDPCSLAVFCTQRVHFLARGDVFQNKILHSIFVNRLGMVPIYRLMEGAENLHKNAETFRISTEKLRENKTILMFPEGICVQERRLRSLRKGMARIAFASEEASNWTLGLKVVPVGLNYTCPKKFRSDFVIRFGKPFEVSRFKEAYIENKASGINELTRYLHEQMAELVLHIQDPANDRLVSQIEEIAWNEKKITDEREKKFRTSEKIVTAINALGTDQASSLRKKSEKYFSELAELTIKDETVKNGASFASVLIALPLLLAGLPFHLFGVITSYPPYGGGRLLANKIAKHVEFHASVNLFSGMFLYMIFYAMQVLGVALLFRNWYVLAGYMILVPLGGWFSLKFHELMSKAVSRGRLFSAGKNKKEEIAAMRNELVNELTRIGTNWHEKEINGN